MATFSGLSIDLVGTSYTLTASSIGLTSASSSPFNITADAATHLVFTVRPANAVAGTPIAPAVTVKAEDAFSNVNTTYAGNVGLVITSGTGTLGAVLTGIRPSPGRRCHDFQRPLHHSGGYGLHARRLYCRLDVRQQRPLQHHRRRGRASGVHGAAGERRGWHAHRSCRDGEGRGCLRRRESYLHRERRLVITGGTGTGGAVLTGGAAVPAVAGVASFSGLFIDLAGASYRSPRPVSG